MLCEGGTSPETPVGMCVEDSLGLPVELPSLHGQTCVHVSMCKCVHVGGCQHPNLPSKRAPGCSFGQCETGDPGWQTPDQDTGEQAQIGRGLG